MDAYTTDRNINLFGGKIRFDSEKYEWQSHDLAFHNLLVTTGGQCRIQNDFGQVTAERGSVLLCLPSTKRRFQVNGAWESFWFGFNLRRHISWNQPIREVFACHPDVPVFSRICADAEEAYTLLFQQSAGALPLAENLLDNIIMRCNGSTQSCSSPRLEAAKNYIASCRHSFDSNHVARKFGMSRTAFFLAFRQAYGITPQKYHEKVRLQNVCNLLITTDLSLSEIAQLCGFSNLYYLSRRFKLIYNCTMKQFRAAAHSPAKSEHAQT